MPIEHLSTVSNSSGWPFQTTSNTLANRLMVLRDARSRRIFKQAVFAICGTNRPTRKQLREVGRLAAQIAGRSSAWGGDHIYVLLHGDRWPKYGINPNLLQAVLRRAGMVATNGAYRTMVLAKSVREGAIILGKSRRCARRRCGIHFVPITPKQKYCSSLCAKRTANAKRRHQADIRYANQPKNRRG